MADNSSEIAEIETILRTGARTVAKDGVSVTYDFNVLRERLAILRREDDAKKTRRPVVSQIDLESGWG